MTSNGSTRVLAYRSENTHQNTVIPDVEVPDRNETRPRQRRKTVVTYFLVNFIFSTSVILLPFLGQSQDHNPALYLGLLVALLSSPLLFARSLTGPYMVLWIATPFFFGMFGLGDLVSYFSDVPSIHASNTRSVISYGEAGILTGIVSLLIGYTVAAHTLRRRTARWFVADWHARTTLIIGLIFFTLGLIATFISQVKFSTFQALPVSRMDTLELNALVLGRMVGELGEILLSYILVTTRSRAIRLLIFALIIVKLPLGIILNSKYIGVSFIIIYVVVRWIYNKNIPWKTMLVWGLAIALMFPLAYTYRAYMGKYYVSVGETLEDISGNLSKALSKEVEAQQERGLSDAIMGGLESVAGRSNMKPAVELIMERTGRDLPYQEGYTLAPLFYILIPRIILPDKPDAPVGQLFNREFNISPSPETWISTSFIGELFWNYSWPGIIIGMLLVGYTYGAVGTITSMEDCTNVVRILIVLITIATLVFKFQTGIAQQYSVFIRSFIIIAFLHMLFRNKKKTARLT